MDSSAGLQAVRITSPGEELTAAFVPGANLVGSSLTHRGVELLHLGQGVAAYAEHGKTMGIPLLHPWANRLAGPEYAVGDQRVTLPPPAGRYATDPNGLPIHGALPGLLRWDVADVSADRFTARLEWRGSALEALFPFPHRLEVTAQAGDDALRLQTCLQPTGSVSVPVSFGYHPYLTVPEIPRGEWEVELGATEQLITDDRMIPTGERRPLVRRRFRLGDDSWDDGLAGLDPPPEFRVAGGPLALTVRFEQGYDFAQVFAPPGQDLICFEPMTAPTNALVAGRDLVLAAPGGEYRAAFSISVAHN